MNILTPPGQCGTSSPDVIGWARGIWTTLARYFLSAGLELCYYNIRTWTFNHVIFPLLPCLPGHSTCSLGLWLSRPIPETSPRALARLYGWDKGVVRTEKYLYQIGNDKQVYWPRFTESLTGKKLTEDQNLSKIQDQLGNQLGDMFGKRGLGEGIGSVLSKGLWGFGC
mgnify:CR=1 FL=1